MPTDSILVDRIDSTPWGPQHRLRHLISGDYADGRAGQLQVSTCSMWLASLCDAARWKHRAIDVTWKDGRAGRELVTVNGQQP